MSTFPIYMATKPDAPEVATTDTILILKSGAVYQTTIAALLEIASSVVTINCSAGPATQDINGYTDIILVKTDGTANVATISDSSGKTIEGLSTYRNGLQNQYETVRLILIASTNNWVRV